MNTMFSTFHWNKASFRFQLSRIWQVLLLLVLLPSLVGMQPTRVSAAPAAARFNNLEACSPVKIMPVGDSITYDYHEPETRPSSERSGYRLPLWELLIEGGYSVDFVGSRAAGEALGQDLVPPFDPDNEGHSGWTDDQIAANIYNWLAVTPADVVLLHIGTNALDTSPGDVEDILDEIDRWEADSGNPVTVLLAQIINRSVYSADTTAFNDNVAALAQARVAAGDEIIVIDMENGASLDYGVDSTPPYDDGDVYDDVHPNDSGYAKMAAAWLNGDSAGSPGLADILPVCATLAVSRNGTGSGTVTSTPAGIDCGSDCTEDYALDMVVTLSAAAGPGSSFTVWSGANAAELVDNGDGTWNLAMDGAKAVTASFSLLPAQEPLGHWTFDESSWAGDCSTKDILDSSGNNRHGIACIDGDAPFPVPGKFGNAGRFDGIDQYANMGPGFNFTSSFTAAMWIALDNYDWCGPTGASQHIIGTHHLATPTGNGRGWGIYWDCDGLAWELTNSTGSRIESYGYVQPSPFPLNGSWHHIALVYDSTVPSATLYWDGSSIYSESGIANVPTFLFNNGEPLTINGLPYAPGAGAPGKIDDTRVYNRVLSGAEIEALAGATPACYTLTLTSGANGGVPTADPLKSDDCTLNGEYLEGAAIALNAHPDLGYRVSAWSGTVDDASTALTNSLSMPAGDHSVTVAYAQEEYTLTITSEHGAVTRNPDQTTYHLNDTVQLTATPETGWTFTGWSGDASGTTNPLNITMDGDKTITANFRGPVILSAPSGRLTSWSNEFSWSGLPNATSYIVEVYNTTTGARLLRTRYTTAQAGCDTDLSCAVSPATLANLANGSYRWRVQDEGAYGTGSWTTYLNFTLNTAVLTLESPSGPLTSWSNVFNWSGLPNATSYIVEVYNTTTGARLLRTRYTTAQAGCDTDLSCAVSPATLANLANGSYRWRVQDEGAYGTGSWTTYLNFTLNTAVLTLESPSGPLTSWSNVFNWSGLPNATSYIVEVYNTATGARLLRTRYTTAQAGCDTDLSCAVSPATLANLANGSYRWRVQDEGAYGSGPFTTYMNFTLNVIPPPVLTLLSPSGPLTSWNNVFNWSGLPNATSYIVEVYNTTTGARLLRTRYTTAQAGCDTDLSCAVSPATLANLANGSYRWRVQDEGSYGKGPFTTYMNFTLNVP